MQQQLFETKTQPTLQSLVISGAGKKALTKNQLAFNKLTQKIERLHKDIEKKQLQFDTALKIYGKEIHPIKGRLAGYRRKLVTILWDVFKSKKLAKTDQRYLKAILKDNVVDLCTAMGQEPDEALKKMFTELEGETVESLRQKENEMIKSDLEDIFEDLDIDVDLEGVDMTDEKALAEKIAEVQRKMMERGEMEQEQYERPKKKKKKTAKREEAERMQQAVEEMKQKNISTIYKQLAKLFHPDLEQDEGRKLEKEILMKELTAAYEAKDLHTLLMLELKWIHKENDHLETLGDEKLAIYLQILREQAYELEGEIHNMYQQPRYQVLVQEFGFQVQKYPVETVSQHLREMTSIDAAFKRDLDDFQSPFGLRHIKKMISEWKQVNRHGKINEEEEFLEMMFKQKF